MLNEDWALVVYICVVIVLFVVLGIHFVVLKKIKKSTCACHATNCANQQQVHQMLGQLSTKKLAGEKAVQLLQWAKQEASKKSAHCILQQYKTSQNANLVQLAQNVELFLQ